MDELELVTAGKHIAKLAVKSLRAGKLPLVLGLRGQLALIFDSITRVEDKITIQEIYKIGVRALVCVALAKKKDPESLLEDELETEPQREESSEDIMERALANVMREKAANEEPPPNPATRQVNPLADPDENDPRFGVSLELS